MSKGVPLHEEPIRRMIAQSIQHHLVTNNRPALPEKPADVDSVVGFMIGPSEIRLRVRLDNGTFRTFTVTLRENR